MFAEIVLSSVTYRLTCSDCSINETFSDYEVGFQKFKAHKDKHPDHQVQLQQE